MNYSSNAGFDLMNNDTDISVILSDYYSDEFYKRKEHFNYIDYGSGVFGLGCGEILAVLETSEKISDFLEVPLNIANEIFVALTKSYNERAFTV